MSIADVYVEALIQAYESGDTELIAALEEIGLEEIEGLDLGSADSPES
jgi:hypothetical protein